MNNNLKKQYFVAIYVHYVQQMISHDRICYFLSPGFWNIKMSFSSQRSVLNQLILYD